MSALSAGRCVRKHAAKRKFSGKSGILRTRPGRRRFRSAALRAQPGRRERCHAAATPPNTLIRHARRHACADDARIARNINSRASRGATSLSVLRARIGMLSRVPLFQIYSKKSLEKKQRSLHRRRHMSMSSARPRACQACWCGHAERVAGTLRRSCSAPNEADFRAFISAVCAVSFRGD